LLTQTGEALTEGLAAEVEGRFANRRSLRHTSSV
jgi:hypothetical protein